MNDDVYLTEEGYSEKMQTVVRPYLEARLESGDTTGGLYYEKYTADGADRTVVILHGFTESVLKFHEAAYYFLRDGANVCLLEQRGHGRSARDVDDLTLTHVRRFEQYVDDLEQFMSEVVPQDKPLMLYAHSMGGAVATLFMEKHPDTFKKAVLSSPMIAPDRGGFPLFASKLVCDAAIAFGKSKKRIFLSSEYPDKEVVEESCATSAARFNWYEKIRRQVPEFQNYSPTYRWTKESLKVTAKILRRGAPERVKTKVLLAQAGLDGTVREEEQIKLANRLQDCTVCRFESAKHEIYRSTDDVAKPYFDKITEFLK